MKKISNELKKYLLTNDNFITSDLYTVTLNSGTVLRLADFDVNIVYNKNIYKANSIIFSSKETKNSVGFGVDNIDITAYYDNSDIIVNGLTFAQALRVGYIDNANIVIEIAFLDTYGNIIGVIEDFTGGLQIEQFTRYKASLTAVANLSQLSNKLPKNVYATSCINSLYDNVCKVKRENYTYYGKLLEGSTSTKLKVDIEYTLADGWLNRGAIEFTTGHNATIRTSIKSHTDGLLVLSKPLPYKIATGDNFFVYAGCERTRAACKDKFNNSSNYRGFNYIPPPESCVST